MAPQAMAQLYYPVQYSCDQRQRYDYTIGNPEQVTVYSGNQVFLAGDYHVIGDLYFKGGTVDIQAGAVFHIDGKINTKGANPGYGEVLGYSLTLGAGSTVIANSAVFNANCRDAMWMGFTFDPNQTGQSLTLTSCGVANALYGINVQSGSQNVYYKIDRCRFEQNLYHVLDQSYHYTDHTQTIPTCSIENSQFYSQPNLLPPFGDVNGLDSWTYVALYLTPKGNSDDQPKIFLRGTNTITGAIYGLLASRPGQALVYQDGGVLDIQRVVRTGIWLDVMKHTIHLPAQVNIGMSNITAGRSYQSRWTAPAEQQYGMVVANNTGYFTDYSLSVTGAGGDTTTNRAQTGALFDEIHEDLQNMRFSSLAYGLNLRAGSGLIYNNAFTNCLHGLRIRPNTGAYSSNFDISCNSFVASAAPMTAGIYINPQATLNDLGSLTYPVGNKFQSYGNGARSIVNDGTNALTYYRYSNSTDEEISAIRNSSLINPIVSGTVRSTTNPSYALNDYCRNLRMATTGVQMRGVSRTGLMQALMDTLRRQAAPVARLGRYQAAIRKWLLQEQPDTVALDVYVRTLATANPNAFYGLGLDLLEQYRRTDRAGLAAALRPVLATRIGAYPAANDRLLLSDVLSRLAQSTAAPLPGRRQASATDSLTLRRLARTPGGTAEMAALWFNYLYPKVGIRAAVPRPAQADAAVLVARLAETATFFPNPATDQLHVEVTVPTGQAVLRVASLLTGKTVLQAPLTAGDAGLRRADVNVRNVPAGQYAATVLVDGVPVTTQKLIINR